MAVSPDVARSGAPSRFVRPKLRGARSAAVPGRSRSRQDGRAGRGRKAVGDAGRVRGPCRATYNGTDPMPQGPRYVGVEVHQDSIAVAVVEADGAERPLRLIPNHPEALGKMVRRLGGPATFADEAGPCGAAGDRVTTDRRDARKLARSRRAGARTAVWVPDEAHEALRDLVRAPAAARTDRRRHRERLTKVRWRLDGRPPAGVRPWRQPDRAWLAAASPQRSLIEALQARRGIGLVTAATLVVEFGDLQRVRQPRELMAYVGLVPSEPASGAR